MSKIQTTSKTHPCPICENATGKCRHTEIGVLCMTFADGENIPGWRYNGTTRDGLWGRYTEDTRNWSITEQREFEDRQRRNQEAREREIERQREQALDVNARDKAIRAISAYVGLNSRHRQDLRDRGLTDAQIDAGLYFSVAKGQQVPVGTPSNLPGIKNGLIATGGSGFACVIFDDLGRAIGWQIRVDNVQSGNKYRWAKNPHLPNGELPLAITKPEEIKRDIPGLCESPLKSRIAAYKLGQTIIGAAGGLFLSSPKQLQRYLGDAPECDIYPDAGDIGNPQVIRRWVRVIRSLQKSGYKVNIAWWGQTTKDSPDCDELLPDTPIQYLDADEWIENLGNIQRENHIQQTIANLHSLSYQPDIELESRYFPPMADLIQSNQILGIVGQKGTGKSVFAKRDIIDKAKAKGWSVISISPRIALCGEQAQKWELQHLNQGYRVKIESGDYWESVDLTQIPASQREDFWQRRHQYQLKQRWQGESDPDYISLCWDSLHKLKGRNWIKTIIVLDEAEQGLRHLLSSDTCKNIRPKLLALFEQFVSETLHKGGMVVLSDADLTNNSIDYIQALAPDAERRIIRNNHPGNSWEVEFNFGKVDKVLSQIEDDLGLGKNIAVATDNQSQAKKLDSLLGKKYPEIAKQIIRIDRETCSEDFGKDFVANADKNIEQIKPRILIYTPSMGTGTSIDYPHFDVVYGLFYGVIEPSDCRQMLARVRQPVPRVVWAADSGKLDNKSSHSFLPEQIKKGLLLNKQEEQLTLNVALEMAKEQAEGCEDSSIFQELAKVLLAIEDGQSSANKHLDLYCKFQAKRNFGIKNLATQLYFELTEEGHSITRSENIEVTAIAAAIKEEGKLINEQEAIEIANAPDIDFEEAQRLSRRNNITPATKREIDKAFLKHELPGVELTPDFVLKAVVSDRRRWLNSVKYFWAFQNPEKTRQKDYRATLVYLKRVFEDGAHCIYDLRTQTKAIEIVRDCGLFELIDLETPQKEYRHCDPEMQSFLEKCRALKWEFKRHLRIDITEDTQPIHLVNRILGKFGLRLTRIRKEGTGGDRVNVYVIDAEKLNDPDTRAVLEALDRAWVAKEEKLALKKAEWMAQQGAHQQQKLESVGFDNGTVPELPQGEIEQQQGSLALEALDRLIRCNSYDELRSIENDYSDLEITQALESLDKTELERIFMAIGSETQDYAPLHGSGGGSVNAEETTKNPWRNPSILEKGREYFVRVWGGVESVWQWCRAEAISDDGQKALIKYGVDVLGTWYHLSNLWV